MDIPKVKIVGEGHMWTKVYNEDGTEIPFVESIKIEKIVGGNKRLARLILVREVEFGE